MNGIRFWRGKKVLVTGGAGFIGSHVVELLVEYKAHVTVLDRYSPRKAQNIEHVSSRIAIINGDCTDPKIANRACTSKEIVLHLAARVGGIEYNRTHQALMMRDNILSTSTTIEAARLSGVKRFLMVSSACIYPVKAHVPTPESEGFIGEPEPSNAGYGWAKRMSEKLAQFYHEQYGMDVGIVRPYNCYGPRDHFEPSVSHVIPALIRRISAGENPIVVWGTGTQTRSFLFVEDAARGMLLAISKYPKPDPLNLGTDEEITIHDLVCSIRNICGSRARIRFDRTKPDGSRRRVSDNTKARQRISFSASVPLSVGLRKTIEWYQRTNMKRRLS